MNINAIKARLGAVGPQRLEASGPGVRRILTEDMPKLIRLAEAALIGHDEANSYGGPCEFCEALAAVFDDNALPATARPGS